MTVATATCPPQPSLPTRRLRAWTEPMAIAVAAFAVCNAVAFYLIRPGVNDLWAARARASAVSHGVGLFYWFSWFGGGSTPGNYSVLTPYVCAAIGTELVGALAAVAVAVLITAAVRGTPHPNLAAGIGAGAVVLNLWSGRVPFLLGAVPGVAAVLAVRHGRRAATVGLTLLSVLASPVAGAFVAVGLSGTFLTTRTKAYRPIIGLAAGSAAAAMLASAVAFGPPGPEPFSTGLLLGLVSGLALLWLAGAPDHLRTTIYVSLIAVLALWAVPNGLGSNFARFVWFCLPVAVAALSNRSARVAALAVVPLLIGSIGTFVDLHDAARPVSSVTYYRTLAARLDAIPSLPNYRVEVVDHGAHAGYDALLEHATLARGWETQEDSALNKALSQDPLDPVTYKVWLDNNAVGYVALPAAAVGGSPEYTLVRSGAAQYLHLIWRDANWRLYRVVDPNPIVGRPASVLARDQKSLTIRVPCACTIAVRVRWSKFLTAALEVPGPTGALVDAVPPADAVLTDDGSGWTVLTTARAGAYVLRGSARGLLH